MARELKFKGTIAERIFSEKVGRQVHAGDFIIAPVDFAMAHETTTNWAIDSVRELGDKIWNPSKTAIFFDHVVPAASVQVANVQKKVREFAKSHGMPYFWDGICHQLLAERFVRPGDLVIGADSHSPTSGALGAVVVGVGSSDIALTFTTGVNWFRVPQTIRININGRLPPAVYAKDLIIHIITKLSVSGATYKSVEFHGSVVDSMDVSDRLTLSNMSAEMGAKCGVCPSDEKTKQFLEQARGNSNDWMPVDSTPDAHYEQIVEINASEIEPTVALPHDLDKGVPISHAIGISVDQVFIGACTNGRLSDLEIAARILDGKKVASNTRLVVTPASRTVYEQAMDKGYIQTLVRAGALVTTPGCGPCLGRHAGVLGDNEVCFATNPRNYQGRMGAPTSKIYCGSPAIAAATAIEGKIADPRKYLR
ncbi:Methanogen homoaconitase large subunit [Candidatus Gugararchaeum adminiculabundum]|nr:Methanogen homoaconitase large subunit [Candidatus Gugararchaeum adminiculabundum]